MYVVTMVCAATCNYECVVYTSVHLRAASCVVPRLRSAEVIYNEGKALALFIFGSDQSSDNEDRPLPQCICFPSSEPSPLLSWSSVGQCPVTLVTAYSRFSHLSAPESSPRRLSGTRATSYSSYGDVDD